MRKHFVIDTNVLIHDPKSIFNFADNVVVITMTVLEELDNLKRRESNVAADARQAIRNIDSVVSPYSPEQLRAGVPVGAMGGKLILSLDEPEGNAGDKCNDNKILGAAIEHARKTDGEPTILVTKDLNMRLKAKILGLVAQDYYNDQLASSLEDLSKGFVVVPGSAWDTMKLLRANTCQPCCDGRTCHEIDLPSLAELVGSEVYVGLIVVDDERVFAIKDIEDDVAIVTDVAREQLMNMEAWGVKPRNIEQAIALDALMDKEKTFVNITGAAGSGKTLLALAAAIEQTVEKKIYKRVVIMRSAQDMDKEQGFLPGTEEEKIAPWMGAWEDNLEVLHRDFESTMTVQMVVQKANIQYKALNYIRGRSFQDTLLILDEAQNCTPHQIKSVITRAGEGTKVLILGNLAQIDTPYLSAMSSGLTHSFIKMKKYPRGASIQLNGVRRSDLAEFAEANL